jgi:response regulator RpfG family c-di-GMP phosphodiesterase
MAERFDLGLVTSEFTFIQRVKEIAGEFNYTVNHYNSIENFLDSSGEQSILISLIRDPKNPNIAAEFSQSAKHLDPNSYVICCVERSLQKETALFAKKSGADLILLEDELYTTSKLEFVITQTLRASYLPLKPTDITVGKQLPFDIFHLMPQRRKFVKFIFKGDIPDEIKMKKIIEVGEVYVHRSKTSIYKKYVEELNDQTKDGLRRRCRAQFMELYSQYSTLVLMLTDQIERTSFSEGEKLLSSCQEICQELLSSLGEFANPWDIINNSTVGEFGSVERSPAIAAYASVFSLQAGLTQIDSIMLVALLVDIGIIFLDPQITKKIRDDQLSTLTPEQLSAYKKYPQRSLDMVLDRKIAMSEKMRTIFISVHEQANGKGFPKGLTGERIPIESQMIQFCKELDARTALRFGKARTQPSTFRNEMVTEEIQKGDRLTPTFLKTVKQAFNNTE